MTAAPDVSVVIPAYNTSQYIAGTIESVLAQTYTSYEVIVVNDGSPDTPAMERALAPFRDRIIYLVQENGGISAARNAALSVARGRYIALLDSDDAWEPDYLAVQVAALEADPSLAVVYPNALFVGDHPHAGRTYMDLCPSSGPVTFQALLTQRCQVFISALIRRTAIERVGGFDPELRSVEDFDLWLRMLATGERIGYHDRVLVRFLKRRDSLSADPVWMAEHVLIVLDKLANGPTALVLPPADRQALEARRAYFRARLEIAHGKRAFFRLDAGKAREHLERANDVFRSPRLRLVCLLLRLFPGVLLKVYRLRDRLIVGADTSF
ncbi:MAG TPA: glycosyltransferase family A protein [Vicinamibacterales bacterium]|nr:glycosyltransferase family A protein [Vicinamibacterales bacterium]